jgi:tRNA-dihydrouridine synthase
MNRVLKSSEVEIDGKCNLDIGHSVSPVQPGKSNAGTAAKAKILDNNNEYTLIELTCSCGKKTLVRCEYGDMLAAGQKKP